MPTEVGIHAFCLCKRGVDGGPSPAMTGGAETLCPNKEKGGGAVAPPPDAIPPDGDEPTATSR
jgi:hypothetical protein